MVAVFAVLSCRTISFAFPDFEVLNFPVCCLSFSPPLLSSHFHSLHIQSRCHAMWSGLVWSVCQCVCLAGNLAATGYSNSDIVLWYDAQLPLPFSTVKSSLSVAETSFGHPFDTHSAPFYLFVLYDGWCRHITTLLAGIAEATSNCWHLGTSTKTASPRFVLLQTLGLTPAY